MVSLLIPNLIPNPLTKTTTRRIKPSISLKPIFCIEPQNPKFLTPSNFFNKHIKSINKKYIDWLLLAPPDAKAVPFKEKRGRREEGGRDKVEGEENGGRGKMGSKKMLMLLLCGFGYWIQGFRCFPWLALNFHMAHNLNFHPSTLQLVQNSANLPMVAKPFYGILSDALYIGGAHRIPYVIIGALPTLMACVLLSNLGAAITEVAQDALVAEYGQINKIVGLQSYTFMQMAVAGILGNSLGGVILSKAHPRAVLSIFTYLLLVQLLITLTTREEALGLSKPSVHFGGEESILSSIKRQFSDLLVALRGETISRPLTWLVASIAMVPMLTGSIFCYQSQFLHLDPSIIGMSKVIGQVILLCLTVLYDQLLKNIPMRKLIGRVQILYAFSFLFDLVLVKQVNLKMGIPNDAFVLCFSGLTETIATFKCIPFFVLIGSLCPKGCEASVTAFLASVLTLSSIVSGFLGIGLASLLGMTPDCYSRLPVGIVVQWLAALVPLVWINNLPTSQPVVEKERTKGRSKRSRRNRRVGRVVLNSDFSYHRERESETQT
ncbi:hypothetical protein Cgig2_019059 [Carnegiea gigantea]|uniref:Uncharacterized protein n=1 Tax=Carnegiea gigantea TaxID=171969 RepID=A0A9Q1QGU7_9CARY|nr:hypothetical protein Cgig2_019059 [Carnegiea gigantea]